MRFRVKLAQEVKFQSPIGTQKTGIFSQWFVVINWFQSPIGTQKT